MSNPVTHGQAMLDDPRLIDHVLEAVGLDARERAALLARLRLEDEALAQRLAAVLSAAESEGPLDIPALDHAGAMLAPEAESSLVGERIGVWRVRDRLGAGGMGVVWRVEREDGSFAMQAALKRVRAGLEDDAARRRFETERAILASLDHPGIARVLDGGVSEAGEPWYAMELVEGPPITHWCDQQGLPIRRRIELLIELCEVIQAAHQRLVVHCDLKPSNVLVDAHGRPRVLDFGISRLLAGEDGTLPGESGRMLTPGYAAPEQVDGSVITTATDVFALGVLAHELLTGIAPFEAPSARARQGTGASRGPRLSLDSAFAPELPDAPSRAAQRGVTAASLRRVLRGDLDRVLEKAVALDPSHRYATAEAFAEDLRAWLIGMPVHAVPDRWPYRARRFAARHAWALGAALAVMVALIALTAFSVRQMQIARAAASIAEAERAHSENELRKQELLREHFGAVINEALGRDAPIPAPELVELVTRENLTGLAHDAESLRGLRLALAEVHLTRTDYPAALAMLDSARSEGEDVALRERLTAMTTRAAALIRLGRVQDAEPLVDRGLELAGDRQSELPVLVADLLIYRSQILRAQGKAKEALATAGEAARVVIDHPAGSPMERGAVIANYAVAAFQAGDFELAIRVSDQAQAVWDAAGLDENRNSITLKGVRGNALIVLGYPAQALALWESVPHVVAFEGPGARAARWYAQARSLALLGRHAEALTLAGQGRALSCASGEDTLDCVRADLVLTELNLAAGNTANAQEKLARARPAAIQLAIPPLLIQADLLDLMLTLEGAEDLRAVLEARDDEIERIAASGELPMRSLLRQLLLSAQRHAGRGHAPHAGLLAERAARLGGQLQLPADGLDRELLRRLGASSTGVPGA
jgi:tetratricopeptide (TPR) repeat protein